MMLAEHHGIPEAEIILTSRGKPTLQKSSTNHLDFSITHDGRWVAVATASQGHIGIDLSEATNFQDWQTFARDYLNPSEIHQLIALPAAEAQTAAARFWTVKEAILKAVGYGLELDPRGITLELGLVLAIRQLPEILPQPQFFLLAENRQFTGCHLAISCLLDHQAGLPPLSIRELRITDLPYLQLTAPLNDTESF